MIDVYQAVTDQIIAQLEKGVVPWRRPWDNRVGRPRNFISKSAYSGVNIILLAGCEFPSPFWLTFLQAKELGGRVKKGARGAMIVKYGVAKNDDRDEDNGRAFLRRYHVFNTCQIDGVSQVVEPEASQETPDLDAAERIVSEMPDRPDIIVGESIRACYMLDSDRVEMPPKERFSSLEDFYLVLFHELIHSTGSRRRLNREVLIRSPKKENVGLEELIAEIGASMLGAQVGILRDDCQASASYIESWLRNLQDPMNRTWIVKAAAQARKAVEFITNQAGNHEDVHDTDPSRHLL